jgi:glycerophosphoryl diester phosphodiesterase
MMSCGPVIEAHRGDSENFPENTLAAFRGAVEKGAASIELDVYQTRDGTWVVMHDPAVDRTTDGTGKLVELSLAEVKKLDAGAWKDPRFAGEPVPTLEETLVFAREHHVGLNIEIKASSGAPGGVDIGTLLAAPDWEGAVEVVSSFDVEALLAVRATAPACPLAMLKGDASALELAREHGFEWVHVQHDAANDDLVANAHAAGIRVMIWTMDDPELYPRWARMGIDKICTNRPGPLARARQDYCVALKSGRVE